MFQVDFLKPINMKDLMTLHEKLFNTKKEIGKISKDSTNPFFKSKYFDINQLLEHAEPILEKYRLLLLQPILEGKVTTQIHDVDSPDIIISEMELPALTDPQKLGSAITYYRRYTLQSLLGLQAEDDDANKASAPVKKYKNDNLPWLNENTEDWKNVTMAIENGMLTDINQVTKYKMSKKVQEAIVKLIG